jgi:hypothetical protein
LEAEVVVRVDLAQLLEVAVEVLVDFLLAGLLQQQHV